MAFFFRLPPHALVPWSPLQRPPCPSFSRTGFQIVECARNPATSRCWASGFGSRAMFTLSGCDRGPRFFELPRGAVRGGVPQRCWLTVWRVCCPRPPCAFPAEVHWQGCHVPGVRGLRRRRHATACCQGHPCACGGLVGHARDARGRAQDQALGHLPRVPWVFRHFRGPFTWLAVGGLRVAPPHAPPLPDPPASPKPAWFSASSLCPSWLVVWGFRGFRWHLGKGRHGWRF